MNLQSQSGLAIEWQVARQSSGEQRQMMSGKITIGK